MNFEELGLSPETLKALADRGYTTPTPIQEKAIPSILMTRDVVGLAQTGTGKTASFTLPMIEILTGGRARARMPRSLVLTPTRELAAQVADNFEIYGKYHSLTKALLVGGESMGDQIRILERGVDVLIATPGRLLDLFDRGNILLNDIKVLVIDEADRMLDMGFIPDIEKIVSKVPPVRQTLLFSATMPPEIKVLADRFLSNPKTVSVAPPASPAETVRQSLIWVSERRKKDTFLTLVRGEDVKNAFVFLNRKRDVSTLARFLQDKGFSAAPMHGDMPQTTRTQTLQDFKAGKVTLLVCSDVAGRGLDIQGVSHVFNYDVPMHADDYVHRIGRTGRAGMQGRAWTIAVHGDDDKFVQSIERLIKKPIPVENVAGEATERPAPAAEESAPARREGGRGERSSRGGSSRSGDKPRFDKPREERPRHESAPAPRAAASAARPPADDAPDRGFDEDEIPSFLRR